MRYGYAAMTSVQAFILALIQGLTEFLPISSSAHAILTPIIFGWQDQGLTFDIVTNAGTLTAVLIYFRQDLLHLATDRGAWRRPSQGTAPLGFGLFLGTLPVVIVGGLFYSWFSTDARNALLIACTSIAFGLLLAWADHNPKSTKTLEHLRKRDALWIGLAQAFALLPGTSRSGVTITAALFLGYSREHAARFSFLLSIPVSVAALLHDLKDLLTDSPGHIGWMPMLVGFVTAAVSAYVVIDWLLAWLQKQSMTVFVVYRIVLGLVILGMLAVR